MTGIKKLILLAISVSTIAMVTWLSSTISVQPAGAYGSGYTGRSTSGCGGCHGSQNTGVVVTIAGPTSVTPGSTNNYTVSLSGSPTNGGGFDLSVSSGTLVIADATNTQLSGGELTQTNPDLRSWNFKWTAPSSAGTATMYVAGNAVNLNGSTSGDAWNLGSLAITVAAAVPTATPTNTAVPPTSTPINTSVPATSTPTNTSVPATSTPTNTSVPATSTPTNTSVPATSTPTNTSVPATSTPTNTPVPPDSTPTDTPVPPTSTPTNTEVPPTSTPTNTAVPPTSRKWEVEGKLQSISGDTWTVSDVTFKVTSGTDMEGSKPTVGAKVEAEGTFAADGTRIASEVEVSRQQSSHEDSDGEHSNESDSTRKHD